jgi:hypothetical protein
MAPSSRLSGNDASEATPRQLAWVASVWRSWCVMTCPIPASAASFRSAVLTPVTADRAVALDEQRRSGGRAAGGG